MHQNKRLKTCPEHTIIRLAHCRRSPGTVKTMVKSRMTSVPPCCNWLPLPLRLPLGALLIQARIYPLSHNSSNRSLVRGIRGRECHSDGYSLTSAPGRTLGLHFSPDAIPKQNRARELSSTPRLCGSWICWME